MALIYIVEDDESIREIEEFALKNAGHKVLGFPDARSFFKKLDDIVPDLCLLDIMLPDESGNEIVRKLRKNGDTKRIPVIMVTAKTTELDLVKGIEDGADDYIKKPFSVMELISRVKALLRRTEPEEVKVLTLDELVLNNNKHEVTIADNTVELTFKEYELLQYLLINKGIVLARDTIMDHIWGMAYEGESRTLDMHIKTLRQKLGDYGSRIRTIRNVGYVIE
ncbi:two-component system OmpR family phosphate regulon response regulator PhoB [Coprococcus sp. CAG:782]|jgi:two-component system alkaline phosphatase synthesis response regulator PhoP|uniref:response regulator transcription factor n=1 Tax=Coprococcus sp. OM04-5BH TaxID=2293093 RepID=UPI00033BAFFA|nr:response regulator transcription factor [Coprococcus sp. OM04-5BH]MEE0035995.1 response regulator transcription factor [Coprococcus sp.]RHV34757.1 DNA-binding response regulator [Coprococcus sp. OM04-5BH]CCY53896.1 two-component system OmpR family phosphate regulon response regulator PhoB [Coprococcus sp. CAG:782]